MSVPTRNYVIASTPRTGSSLLCEGLERTGIAGRPAEVFAPDFRGPWFEAWDVAADAPFGEYLRAARRYGTGRNGVYGVKIQYMHVEPLARLASFPGESDDVLEFLFPRARYVNLVRRDAVSQALSWFRAIRTQEWFRSSDARGPRPPEFDGGAIDLLQEDLRRQQAAWERHFGERGIAPLVVEYESLAADYCGEIGRVLSFLGLDAAAARAIPPPTLVRQADAITVGWRDRMLHRT